jgi:hypothetical protein
MSNIYVMCHELTVGEDMEEEQENKQPNNNAIIPLAGDEEWNAIVSRLVNEIADKDMPEKVVQATEMLMAGFPIHKIAKKLRTDTKTIRGWMTAYPTMTAIVADSKKLISKWRLSKLEQQFLTAVDLSQSILDISLTGIDENGNDVDAKVLTVLAAQARYIIGIFAGQKQDITVKHELGDTVMKAREDALNYLAEKLIEQKNRVDVEPIEATYRILDNKVDDTGPFLDEDGRPPFGEMGKLDIDDDGILCHVCGRRFKAFSKHVTVKHNTPVDEYEILYMLEEGIVLKSENH